MSHSPRSRSSPRARAVAEAPIEAMLARVDELARRWAIALILERPLERIAELHLEKFAREAPVLCAQMIRALESDAELERLADGDAADGRGESASAHKLVVLAGAGDAGSAVEMVEAVEALRGVLWEALLDELRQPISERSLARQVADLADRLSYVCATVLAVAVAAVDDADEQPAAPLAESPAAGSGATAPEPRSSPVGPRRAILIDEHEPETASARPGRSGSHLAEPGPAEPRPPERHAAEPRSTELRLSQADPPEAERRQARPLPWDPPAARSSTPPAAPVAPRSRPPERAAQADPPETPADGAGVRDDVARGPEIEVRDERGEEGPAAWIVSIGRQLEHFEQDQVPFAVLLVELGDAERLRRAALPAALSSLTGRIERTLTQELQRIGGYPAQRQGRAAGVLACERPGRYWLLAPGVDAVAARRLAEWVVQTIGPLAGPRWAPLEVMVGIAMCPEDGRDAAALAAHADLGLYAPRPSGR